MDNLITIATFDHPNELTFIKGRLETEGIECFLKDELTAQVFNIHTNAMGGVKLQVKETDVAKAIEILKLVGYLKESDIQTSKFWNLFDLLSSKIGFINKFRIELRFIILIALISTAALITFIITTTPSTYEELTAKPWCVDYLSHKEKYYKPFSKGLKKTGSWFCEEPILFRTNGVVIFPGFNTNTIKAKWKLTDNVLHIFEVDTFQHIFKGAYSIELEGNFMTLSSEQTSIICFRK